MTDIVLDLLCGQAGLYRRGTRVDFDAKLHTVRLPVLPPIEPSRGIKLEVFDNDEHRTYVLKGEPVFWVDANARSNGEPSDLIRVEWHVMETLPSMQRNDERDGIPGGPLAVPRVGH